MVPTEHYEIWLKVVAKLRADHKDKSAAELVHDLDANGKQLGCIRSIGYAAGQISTLVIPSPELRTRWSDPEQRAISRFASTAVGASSRFLPSPRLCDTQYVLPDTIRIPPISNHRQPGDLLLPRLLLGQMSVRSNDGHLTK